MSVHCCACVFTLFLGCLFRCNLFFCLKIQLKNGRLYFNASLGWSFCPRYWAGATEWLEHVVLLLYVTCCCFLFFYRRQWTLHWRFHRFLLVAQSVGVSRVFAFTFAVQICTVGACFFFFNSGAAILWLQLFSFFFGLVTKVAVVFLWVLVPLETVFPAKNSNNTCCTRPFRGSEHN